MYVLFLFGTVENYTFCIHASSYCRKFLHFALVSTKNVEISTFCIDVNKNMEISTICIGANKNVEIFTFYIDANSNSRKVLHFALMSIKM